jgi:exodeoxyribonuclease-3
VASLGALLRKDPAALARLAATEGADAIALQETKVQEGAPEAESEKRLGLPGWHVSWASSTAKKGYSGVAIATRHAPLSVRSGVGLKEADDEGE